MTGAAILLYNFTAGEVGALRLLLREMPAVCVIPVDRMAFGMKICDVLAGKNPLPLCVGRNFFRKMLLLAGAEGQMFHFLLAACGRITEEKVLRAVLTETNKDWSGSELYDNLLEEEIELEALK